MTDGYEEVYGDVASQRRQIAEGRSQLAKPVVGGSAKQRRITMRSLRKTPEHRTYVKAKKEQLSALGSAEVELAEHEATVKEYEEQGYDVAKTEEGYQFTKYTPGKRVRVGTKPRSVKITWQEKGGKIHSNVHTKSYSWFKKRLARDFPGATITKVTTTGGGALYKTEAGHWSTKDVVLAEAKPIYETIKTKQTGKQLGDITVHHIGMDKKLDLGFGKQDYIQIPTSDAELAMIRQSDISRVGTMREMTEARIVGYEAIKDIPDPLAWSNKEMQKIEHAYKIHPLLGGTAELGFGITTAFASLGKPVFTGLTGKKLPHYVTWFDVPFGNRGGTEFLGKHPIYAGGSLVGEAAQVIAFWGTGKTVKTGLVSGTKFFVRKAPKFVGKLKTFTGVSRPLLQSESMLFEGGMKIIGRKPTLITKTFGKVETLGRTPFWKNIAGWSEGKLVFAKAYPMAKGYPKVFSGDKAYGKITKYKGFGKRVLEIPKVVKQEQVGSALSIQFKGTGGGKLSRTIIYRSVSKPKGMFRKEIRQVFISSHKGSQYQKIMADTGGGFIRPFLSKEAKRIPVMRITQKGFIGSTEASARLVPTVTIPHHVSSSMGARGFGSLGREPLILSFTQPSSFIAPSIVATGVRSISARQQERLGLTGLTEIQMNIQRGELAYKQGIDTEQIQKTLPSYAQIDMQINKTIQKQQQKQAQSYKLITKQTYQPVDKTFQRYFKPARGTVVKPPVVVPFPLPDFEGKPKKRKKKKEFDELFKGHRFRSWKVPTVKQLIGMRM